MGACLARPTQKESSWPALPFASPFRDRDRRNAASMEPPAWIRLLLDVMPMPSIICQLAATSQEHPPPRVVPCKPSILSVSDGDVIRHIDAKNSRLSGAAVPRIPITSANPCLPYLLERLCAG
jgi:hypothetical protein